MLNKPPFLSTLKINLSNLRNPSKSNASFSCKKSVTALVFSASVLLAASGIKSVLLILSKIVSDSISSSFASLLKNLLFFAIDPSIEVIKDFSVFFILISLSQ